MNSALRPPFPAMPPVPRAFFTDEAKRALLKIQTNEERVEVVLFLLQTAIADSPPFSSSAILGEDVRSAQLMMELRMHLLGEA